MKNLYLKVFSRTSSVGNKYLKFVLYDKEGHSCIISPVFAEGMSVLLGMADNINFEVEEDKEEETTD